jgi:Tfp pilus assembly protein PilZ
MPKNTNLKKYNPTIARLLEVILSMSEEQQKTILKQADDLVQGDRRITDRKSCDLQVDFATTERAHKGYIKNMSTKGVFIEAQAPIVIGEEVLMVFKVNRDSEAIKLRGEIAHATRWGIGIEFIAKGPHFDQEIRSIIQRIR